MLGVEKNCVLLHKLWGSFDQQGVGSVKDCTVMPEEHLGRLKNPKRMKSRSPSFVVEW
jgi:hypothetical protein